MTIYRGLSGVNREIKQQFRGISGVNREIKEQYRGYDGVNRNVFSCSNDKYLYKRGDEKSSLTGGWDSMCYRTTYTTDYSVTENADHIEIRCKGAGFSSGQVCYTHQTPVDVTNYTTIHLIAKTQYANDKVRLAIGTTRYTGGQTALGTLIPKYTLAAVGTTESEITLDISTVTGNNYIYIGFNEEYLSENVIGSGYYYEVWLS